MVIVITPKYTNKNSFLTMLLNTKLHYPSVLFNHHKKHFMGIFSSTQLRAGIAAWCLLAIHNVPF